MNQPRPESGSGSLFVDGFYEEELAKIDPDEQLPPESKEFLNNIANDFLSTVFTCASNYVRKSDPDPISKKKEIKPSDLYFILKDTFGFSLPGPTGQMDEETPIQTPTKEYTEKLRIVRDFALNKGDE